MTPSRQNGHSKSKRVLIVDDHPVLRKGLGRLIDSKNEFSVCGEAGDAAEALDLIRKLEPDLAIVDISLPGINGIELTKTIRKEFPKLSVLILSVHEEQLYALRALRAGAMGYIVKQDAIENITAALREVSQGRRYISAVLAGIATNPDVELGDGADPAAILSDRELEIFELIGNGHEVREISNALGLSPKTVETHRTNIKDKLKLKNARHVARLAVQWTSEHSA